MKSGTIAIVGRPNVGKSTLLNALIREKIAIVSDKPQTTRSRLLGVAHHHDAQLMFLDTPGLHKPYHQLNRRMVWTALESLRDADLVYLMMEASSLPGPNDRFVAERVRAILGSRDVPLFLLINKVDLVSKTKLLPIIEAYQRTVRWTELIPISAMSGSNVDRLVTLTIRELPEGDPPFDEDALTDQPMRAFAAEIIREKILARTHAEIPYAVAVKIDQFLEEDGLARILASILVERDSQKAILIGKGGGQLKHIGTAARVEMERLFDMKVYLDLWVRVHPSWREDDRTLVELGY